MKTLSKTEKELREEKVPRINTTAELVEYIDSLVAIEHDYGTCVYAMSMAAVAAFTYVAGILGVTGFQASCADLDVLRRTRGMKGPFCIINGEDMLYPQYDLPGKLKEAMDSWMDWASIEARKKLAEKGAESAHPNVYAHWQKLAKHQPKEKPVDSPR